MSPHYTRTNIVKTIGLTNYLHNLDIFKVVYIDVNQMLISFECKENFLMCEFFYGWYLHLSSMALCYWIHDGSQNPRDHLISKLLERVGGALSP